MKINLSSSSDAIISKDGKYRYALWRHWEEKKLILIVVMLNPSTADAIVNDPTIIRVINFAKKFGFGGVLVLNLFALRSMYPKDLLTCKDPVGPKNNKYFDKYLAKFWQIYQYFGPVDNEPIEVPVLCAWGAGGYLNGQDKVVLGWLRKHNVTPYCLGTTKQGHPKHPLYISNDTEMIKFRRLR